MEDVSITQAAAQVIKKSALESQTDNLPLRIAVTKQQDGSFHYGMGFDDVGNEKGEDSSFHSQGVDIVVSENSIDLLKGTVIDYIELSPKEFHFVFLNPNDPNYQPGATDAE